MFTDQNQRFMWDRIYNHQVPCQGNLGQRAGTAGQGDGRLAGQDELD